MVLQARKPIFMVMKWLALILHLLGVEETQIAQHHWDL